MIKMSHVGHVALLMKFQHNPSSKSIKAIVILRKPLVFKVK